MQEERIIDRFDAFARYRNLSDATVTRECNLAVGTLGKSRKPGKDLTRRSSEKLIKQYPELSRRWLLEGLGEMLADTSSNDYPHYPLIDMARAECGRPGGLSEAIMSEGLPLISIPGTPRDTEFFVQATGYSMVDEEHVELSIPPGALVGVAKIKEQPYMRWGEVYVISTPDGLMIKQLREDDDPEFVRCVSYNPAYAAFRLPKNEILECARITCVVPVYLR